MNKFEAFLKFSIQKPSVILCILLMLLMFKMSFDPLGVPIIDEALKQVPWWITNLGLIIIIIKNINYIYTNFKKYCKSQGIQ